AHLETYHAYRSALERLIDGFLTAEGRSLPPGELHRLAVACNAVIDGLWVEGAMLPQKLPGDEVIRVAMESISAILDVDPAVLA
ncbi:MAG: TetR family transcriptional regulator C-terminal domain-containing protein, partial [Pseudomonadota bacterium]